MSVAEVKFVASSGASVVDVLRQIKSTTKDVGAENAKILTQIRDQAKAEHEAAAAAREVAEAARRSAAEAAKAAKATREHKKEIAETQAKIDAVVDSTVSWAKVLGNVHANLEKIAGVKAFSEMNKDVNNMEEAMTRMGMAMGTTQEKLEAMFGKKGKLVYEIAADAGVPADTVRKSIEKVQNAYSKGEEFTSNNGQAMKGIMRFANVTGAEPEKAAEFIGGYADMFKMNPNEMDKFEGDVYQQQLTGSLEAKTSGKYLMAAQPYMNLTGRTGRAGADELLAMGNVLSTGAGLAKNEEGVARGVTMTRAALRVMSDPKKRGALEKALGHALPKNTEGGVDIAALANDLGTLKTKKGQFAFNDIMGSSVRDSMARDWFVAMAGRGKEIYSMAHPDTEKGRAAIDDNMQRLFKTENVKKLGEENTQLAAASETHGIVNPSISDTHKAGGRFRVLHPQLAAMLGEGYTMSAIAGASQYGAKAANWVQTLDGRPRDELGGTKWDAQALQKKIAQFEENERKGSGVRLPADDLKLMREELSLLLADIKAMEKGKGEGVTVNNNIQISAPGVEARVTQEAQPTPNKAQNGSKPAAARGAGVR